MSRRTITIGPGSQTGVDPETEIYLSGELFHNGSPVIRERLRYKLKKIDSLDQFRTFLQKCAGEYTLVVKRDNEYFAALGPTRSAESLFYSTTNGGYLSNDYGWVERQLPSRPYSESIANQFLLFGYIPGGRTLHDDIFRLRPGTALHLSTNEVGSGKVSLTEYYTPTIVTKPITDRSEAESKLEVALNKVFGRIKQIVKGRPIILKLSGGYDSRLCSLMIYKHKFKNVYAFTKNTQDPGDTELAKKVSNSFGFKWCGVEYSAEDYRDVYESDFWHQGNNLVGTYGQASPGPEFFLDLQKIVELDDFPNSGVILRGATPADSIGNSFPGSFLDRNFVSKDEVENAILDKYQTNPNLRRDNEAKMQKEIGNILNLPDSLGTNAAIGKLIQWYLDYHDAKPKNAISLEYGYVSLTPFHSRDFIEVFNKMAPEMKYQREIFESYTEKLNNKHLGGLPIGQDTQDGSVNTIKRYVANSRFRSVAKSSKDFVEGITRTSMTPEEFREKNPEYGFMPADRIAHEFTGDESHKYFLAIDELARSRLEPKNEPLSDNC